MYVGLTSTHALLYNTIDRITIESDKCEVIELLQATLQHKNYGVILLSDERLQNKSIKDFIRELRMKYMGDIIDVTLSKGKPIQLLPFFNFLDTDKFEIYKRHNFSLNRNVLNKLFEISIYVDNSINIKKLIPFLESVPEKLSINIIGNIEEVTKYKELLSFLNIHDSPKNMVISYMCVIPLQPVFDNNFSYSIEVSFPVDSRLLYNSMQILHNQALPFEYIFSVSSLSDCQQANQLIEKFQIEKYQLRPIYTGDNIHFFKENVFISKEDILSTHISIRDIFANQILNTNDFGKVNIMPNGDVFANLNHPSLGNIYKNSIYDLIRKEILEGKSWLRIRNQDPCNECVYQWLCPSPSDYEIAINSPNLCHVKNQCI